MLAAVDFDLRFTYVLAGWEGSAHDALILTDALQRPDGLKVPQGKTQSNAILSGHTNTKLLIYLSPPIFRKILPCRCWVCLQAWILTSILSH